MRLPPEERLAGAVVAAKYRIKRVLGTGSMGVVCEAEHIEIGKRVALKVIDASLAGMKDIALRFRQEARAASLVESQHIVQVFDVGTDDALGLYLVMEYLTGEDLAQRLEREGRLAPDDAVRIAVQAARGVSRAHGAGVVHRDLKPANVFLCEREDGDTLVKILDFGISKVIDASRAEWGLKLTRAGMVVGTPQYMSPEQAQGLAVDERTDVWALGLVLYEMLAGRPAYPELPTYEQFIIHLVSSPPERLDVVAPWVPTPLADAVHAAIEHKVDRRIRSCAELASRVLTAHPVEGQPLHSVTLAAADALPEDRTTIDRSPVGRSPARLEARAAPASAPRESVDIELDSPDPTPPPATARDGAVIASSGVRGRDAESLSDDGEDAPQFFDRRSLGRLAAKSAAAGSGAQPALPARAVSPARAAPAPASALAARRPPAVWAVLALVAVGLMVAVALALR